MCWTLCLKRESFEEVGLTIKFNAFLATEKLDPKTKDKRFRGLEKKIFEV